MVGCRPMGRKKKMRGKDAANLPETKIRDNRCPTVASYERMKDTNAAVTLLEK